MLVTRKTWSYDFKCFHDFWYWYWKWIKMFEINQNHPQSVFVKMFRCPYSLILSLLHDYQPPRPYFSIKKGRHYGGYPCVYLYLTTSLSGGVILPPSRTFICYTCRYRKNFLYHMHCWHDNSKEPCSILGIDMLSCLIQKMCNTFSICFYCSFTAAKVRISDFVHRKGRSKAKVFLPYTKTFCDIWSQNDHVSFALPKAHTDHKRAVFHHLQLLW